MLWATFFLYFLDAFFWTVGPLYIASAHLGKFGGLFLTAYILPSLFSGWFVAGITERFGKKKTAIWGIFLGCALLTSFVFIKNAWASVFLVFVASSLMSFSLPAINASYADYISETPEIDSEIEGIEDFAANLGYVAGPISAGLLSGVFGISAAFSILGGMGFALAIILFNITPKRIGIRIAKRYL